MSLRHKPIFLFIGFSTLFFAVCSLYAASGSPSAPQEARILATVDLGDGHTVVFQEFPSGILSVAEASKSFQTPVLLGNIAFGKSMANIYRMIQPKGHVPDSLVSADAHLARQKSIAAPQRIPDPPQIESWGRGPKPYDAGNQAWFKQTFCHDNFGTDSLVNCIQAFDWIHSGWQRGAIVSFDTMVGCEGRDTAQINQYYWDGSKEILLAVDSVAPCWVSTRQFQYFQPFWWHVDLEGTDGNVNTQVSQDVRTCGNGGQWACSRNCGGSIACNSENTSFCSIVGGQGESFCNR
jgi:hypothetical protein